MIATYRLLFALICIVLGATAAWASTYTTLHTFRDGADGQWPSTGLVVGPGGALYGADSQAVFKLEQNDQGVWSFTPIFYPKSTVSALVGTPGALYGVQTSGGTAICTGFACGTLVALTPPPAGKQAWALTVLHQFTGGSDGARPWGLALGPDGALYGTTVAGGGAAACGSYNGVNTGCGMIYALGRATGKWTETLLHPFAGGSDGAMPMAAPSFDSAGNIYVTTFEGGATAPSKKAVDPSCAGNGDIARLAVIGRATGTIIYTVMWFALCEVFGPQNIESVFLNYIDDINQARPAAAAAANGGIFTTEGGGHFQLCPELGSNGCGDVAKLTAPANGSTPWTMSLIHAFQQTDGAVPYGALLADGASTLYGVTKYGGADSLACEDVTGLPYGCGVLYTLTKGASGWGWGGVVHGFGNVALGAEPVGQLLLYKGAVLGVTTYGGDTSGACAPYGCGVVFSFTP